jgi:hypothetical protein
VPEIEHRDNYLDGIWILALMVFPNDEYLRRQFYAVKFVESELEGTVPTDCIEIGADVIREILDSPAKSKFLEIVGKQTRDAIIAGNVLATVFAMDSFSDYFDEPSERKAIFVAQKFAEKTRYGDGSKIPHTETKIRGCMKDFRSVAHLWAAMTLHEGFPIREQKEILASPDAVRDFLGIAGTLQDFGCNFAASRTRNRDKKPILDHETIWRVPADTKRLIPPWTAPPPWIVETLDDYRANKSKN